MVKVHVFEQAGLGIAPYQFCGVEKISYQAAPGAPCQPGGSCDYCGTGIHFHYFLQSADGKRFKVGSDCIMKSGDAGLKRIVSDHERTLRQQKANMKRNAEVVHMGAAYVKFNENIAVFEHLPHPRGFTDFKTGHPLTLADYVRWMVANAGHSGRYATAQLIVRTLEATSAVAA